MLRFAVGIVILVTASCAVSDQPPLSEWREFEIRNHYFSGRVSLSPTTKGFRILLSDAKGQHLDQTMFSYRPYRLDTADVNHDGRTEILIGLIKPTEFDPQEKKRLFILRIDEGQLRPMWLGSKVCQQLVDFKALTNGSIRTLEQTKDGNYAIGTYQWQGFGLTLVDYTHNNKSYDEAIDLFAS